ncbi:MAG: CBS domain-containing protein [Comamonas sp.]|nr:CBS domain-containing protein [Comamonas sp.]
MKVSDILRVKGGTLYVVKPDDTLAQAMVTMADKDMGSLVVVEAGQVVGMLTFREVINTIVKNGGAVGASVVREAMESNPLLCTVDTDMNQVRLMMLERHARYMPVMDGHMLMGVVSFYDVAKAVVEEQNFENQLLKAYIRDWPETEDGQQPQIPGTPSA